METADRHFRSIVALYPQAHAAWNALSFVAVRRGMADIAVEHSMRALKGDRRNAVYLNNLGIAYAELTKFKDAESCFRKALTIQPGHPEALFNLGKVLVKERRLGESIRAFERAYAIDRRFPGLAYAFAEALRKAGQADRALEVLRQGMPELGQKGLTAIGDCIGEVDGPRAQLAYLEDVLQRAEGDSRWVAFRVALLRLSLAQWKEGWTLYPTYRASNHRSSMRGLDQRLDGKHFLLVGEQGIGDQLFFLRFAPLLAARGARMSLVTTRRLASLLLDCESFEHVLDGDAEEERGMQHDGEILIGDLPLLLEAWFPPKAWRLHPTEEMLVAARERLAGLGPPPYLAVTWRAGIDPDRRAEIGNPQFVYTKYVPPFDLGCAVRGWRGTVIALQRELYPEELEEFARGAQAPVQELGRLGEDLHELIAYLALVDEYVTVSNTNVHLMVGLGKVARVLVPFPPEWRWMATSGRSAWFPDCPAYRQRQDRDWSHALAQVRQDLYG